MCEIDKNANGKFIIIIFMEYLYYYINLRN